jgi:hypothetical protein
VTELKKWLLREGVITIDGFRWSDGYAWCELRPTYDNGRNSASLRYIWASECRKGHGTALLKKLLRAADKAKKTLWLEVAPFMKAVEGAGLCHDTVREGGMTRLQLSAWYESHGFEQADGKIMVRRPIRRNPENPRCRGAM